MNYAEFIKQVKDASLFDLYRLSVALRHELNDPERIAKVRNSFQVHDRLQYFDARNNALRGALILEKRRKYVRIQDLVDNKLWRIPYQMLKLDGDIAGEEHASSAQQLDRHSLRVGETIGFSNKDGENIYGLITRLNQRTVSIVTPDRRRWRVSYSFLFKVIDGNSSAHDAGSNGIKFIC